MLCPEVWQFQPPSSHSADIFVTNDVKLLRSVEKQYFNYFVAVTLPNTLTVPENLIDSVLEDSDYYKVEHLPAYEFVQPEFIQLFVAKGQLTLLSANTKLDEDDSIAITPTGKLLLSLNRKTYQQLGVTGRPAKLSSKFPSKYIVEIDLQDKSFVPSKKNYEHVVECLKKSQLCFDIILSWEPSDESVCPSSIAAFFHNKLYRVTTKHVSFVKRHDYNVPVPTEVDQSEAESLLEWLGMYTLSCSCSEGDGFVSSYHCPEPNTVYGQVAHLQFKGLITATRISQLVTGLREYVKDRCNLCWASVHVQGFEDSILNGEGLDHSFYISGDYHYTVFMRHDMPSLLRQFMTSTKKPSAKTKKRR